MDELLLDLMNQYEKDHARVEKLRGQKYDKIFRIHWDGDFFSTEYAQAWRNTIVFHPTIQFWAYTRSFTRDCNVVPILEGIDNLALYLSVDKDNALEAGRIVGQHPSVRVAFLDQTFEQATLGIRNVTGRRAPACPEQTGYYPLIVEDKQEGACSACSMCVNGTNNVLFSISKK